MYESKLTASLRYLNVYELSAFEKFLQSPYFNQNEKILNFYGILLPFLKPGKEIRHDKFEIWEKLFGKEDFNDKNFRRLNSDLLRLLEKFIAQQVYDRNEVMHANHLMDGVSKKGIVNMFSSTLSAAERLSERHFNRNSEYYHQLFMLEKKRFNLTTEYEKKSKKKSRYNILNIKEISDNIDVYYLAEKLRLIAVLYSFRRIMKIETDLNFTDEIVKMVESLEYEKYPPLAIYYRILLTLREGNNLEHYDKLKELIAKYIHLFPEAEAEDIYESALNYCISKVNSGLSQFFDEILNLYKGMINNDILKYKDNIDPTAYRNIVISAIRVKDFKWAEWFIEAYKGKLDEKYRDNAVTFNLARLYYYKRELEKVKRYLRDVEFDDLGYELSAKAMLIATYYDTDDFTPLYSLLDSFYVFLNRNKKSIPEQRRRNYILLIKFVKKLMSINIHDKTAVQKLRDQIEASGDIPDKQWLLDRVSVYEK
jgi:hypothetical protein